MQKAAQRTTFARFAYKEGTQAAAITLAFLVLRLLICPFVGLGTNEAYAIASGRLMSLSYFDHPPLHFWLAHLGELIFGDNRAARIPFILLGGGTSLLIFGLTRKLFGARAGVWAVLAFNLSIFFDLVASNWILPDGPLNFFLLAAALTLASITAGERLSAPRWALVGLLTGLAAISKYHAIIFAVGVFFYLASKAATRRSLLTAGPWLAVIVALLVFSPVLIWNADHGWISFRFQTARAGASHYFGLALFLTLLAGQLALIAPWNVWPLFKGIVASRGERDEADRLLLWLGLPSALFFTIVPLWSNAGMVHWAMPGWLLLLPLAGKYLAKQSLAHRWPLRWAAVSTGIFLTLVLFAGFEFQTEWLGARFSTIFRHGNPTAENAEWTPIVAVLNRDNPADAKRNFVLTESWRDAAKIDQSTGGSFKVAVMTNDPRNFAIGFDKRAWMGRDGWVALPKSQGRPQAVNITRCFSFIRPDSTVSVARGGRADAVIEFWRGEGFDPQHCDFTNAQKTAPSQRAISR